ncbi:MAG: hypothetical protein KDE53_37785 [Caldilineaceae bacterium]|nr:hypothetical protein [Caldilineaceae bacterium]
MAESPSHKLGQIIGNLLEAVMYPLLAEFCASHDLYLDFQGRKRSIRRGRKVTWIDGYGNKHDLDYVIEKNGRNDWQGDPIAFIEVAWRRYTRHSRNKAQEIQGAILPLAEKYHWANPFLGVVLAGEFTDGSIEQLRSLRFKVLYFPYDLLLQAFAAEGVILRFDESTSDQEFQEAVDILQAASPALFERVKQNLVEANQTEIQAFLKSLTERVSRSVTRIVIIPLYGRENTFASIQGALEFLNAHPIYEGSGAFRKYEVYVTFSDGDRVQAEFQSKQNAREFLTLFASGINPSF